MSDEVRKRIVELSEHLEASDADTQDLQSAVESFGADGNSDDLVDRLREGALRFESSHPELSAVVARVIDSLTAAGI